MKKVNIIFCLVVYKNFFDLLEFIENLEKRDNNFSYDIVIVNNFADTKSLEEVRKIAKNKKLHLIENKNTGYGDGNNKGIEYIKNNYEFEYLIVSNADIELVKFSMHDIRAFKNCVIAPQIITLNGRNQNPFYYKYSHYSEKIIYFGYRYNIKLLIYIGIVLNKLNKMKYRNKLLNGTTIYACHGSFIIFDRKTIFNVKTIFDSEIFLFSEENDLAKNLEYNKIPIYYCNNINILHKEDGSMSISNVNLYKESKKSFMYYYKKWNKEKKI